MASDSLGTPQISLFLPNAHVLMIVAVRYQASNDRENQYISNIMQ